MAEGLAGIPGNEAIHDSTKLFAWEGFEIRVYRGKVDLGLSGELIDCRHTLRQYFARIKFDLRVSECSHISDNSIESHANASVSGAPLENVERSFGIIHISSPLIVLRGAIR